LPISLEVPRKAICVLSRLSSHPVVSLALFIVRTCRCIELLRLRAELNISSRFQDHPAFVWVLDSSIQSSILHCILLLRPQYLVFEDPISITDAEMPDHVRFHQTVQLVFIHACALWNTVGPGSKAVQRPVRRTKPSQYLDLILVHLHLPHASLSAACKIDSSVGSTIPPGKADHLW